MKRTIFCGLLALAAIAPPRLPAQSPDRPPPGPVAGRIRRPPPPAAGGEERPIMEQGMVEAKETSVVGPLRSIDVNAFLVEEGEIVEKGQLLIELDPDQKERTLEEARLQVAALEAELEASKRVGFPREKIDLEIADLQSRQELKKARLELRAQEKLREQNLCSDLELQASRTATRVAELKARRTQLLLETVEEGEKAAALRALEAKLKTARNQLAELEEAIGDQAVRAPHAGRVLRVIKEQSAGKLERAFSQNASPTSRLNNSVTVSDIGEVIVNIHVFQSDISRVEIGDRVSVRADYAPGREFAGKVTAVGQTAIPRGASTSVFLVKAMVDNSEHLLLPTTVVEVTINPETATPPPEAGEAEEGNR